MLRIDKVQTLEGLQVYADDSVPTTSYVLPEQPRFRLDDEGRPVFKFLKYKRPRPREDGKNGGGFVVFDVEFAVDDAKQQAILEQLKAQASASHLRPELVKLGTIQWAKGTAQINVADVSGIFVEKVFNPASPSLFGRNITPFTVELTQEGATLFEQALQGKGGFVQVAYQMSAWVKLPPLTGNAWFHSFKFYEFVQDAKDDAGWGDDTFVNDISERLESSESMGVVVDAGMGVDDKVKAQIRDSLFRTLEDTVTKKMLEQVNQYTGDRTVYDDYETVRRSFTSTKIDDFSYTITENSAALWPFNPQGTLPNITTLVDKSGAAVRWSDYAVEVDLDDPFFRTLSVNVRVNAELDTLPINSIDVHLGYGTTKPETADFHFTKPDDIGKFSTFLEGDVRQYTYSYIVNFEGASRTFESPPAPSERGELTINVDDSGLLLVDVNAGNLDFTKVASALVTVRYEPHTAPVIEEQYLIDKANTTHQLQKAIFEKRDQPLTYQVVYTMVDGKTYTTTKQTTQGRQIFANSPFNDTRQVSFRAVGDLTGEIDAIDVDASYIDEANDYRVAASHTMKAGEPFWDWSFPVIDAAGGQVTYSGMIRRKDGTVEAIAPATAERSMVTIGEEVARLLEVTVVSDLVDFTQVALVKVALRYRPADAANEQSRDLIIKASDGSTPHTWNIELADPTQDSYAWSATYYMVDQSHRDLPETTTDDPAIVLPPVPAA